MLFTLKVGYVKDLIKFSFSTLQILIVSSQDPEAKISTFGENATLETLEVWPQKVLELPLYKFHSLISLVEPETKYFPFGEKAKLITS